MMSISKLELKKYKKNFDFGIVFPDSPPPSKANSTSVSAESKESSKAILRPNIDNEINNFLQANKSKSTSYNTINSCRRLNLFLHDRNPLETREFHELSDKELDLLLCDFFMYAKKIDKTSIKNSNENVLYQPDTLTVILTVMVGKDFCKRMAEILT